MNKDGSSYPLPPPSPSFVNDVTNQSPSQKNSSKNTRSSINIRIFNARNVLYQNGQNLIFFRLAEVLASRR